LGALDPSLPEGVVVRSDVSIAWRSFERALDNFMQASLIAPGINPITNFLVSK
jgi:hypothetical protein